MAKESGCGFKSFVERSNFVERSEHVAAVSGRERKNFYKDRQMKLRTLLAASCTAAALFTRAA